MKLIFSYDILTKKIKEFHYQVIPKKCTDLIVANSEMT